MGLYTPTILGGNSYLSWFYDRGAIQDPAHTGTSTGLSQAINRGPIRKFLPKYANVYVTIQSHGLSAGVRSHYVTANGVRNGLLVLMTTELGSYSTAAGLPQRLENLENESGHGKIMGHEIFFEKVMEFCDQSWNFTYVAPEFYQYSRDSQ